MSFFKQRLELGGFLVRGLTICNHLIEEVVGIRHRLCIQTFQSIAHLKPDISNEGFSSSRGSREVPAMRNPHLERPLSSVPSAMEHLASFPPRNHSREHARDNHCRMSHSACRT